MIIATVSFGDPVFEQMAQVLEYSVRANCPEATFLHVQAEPHTHIKGIPTHCPANAHKKRFWGDVVHEHPGQEIVLLDCDTLVLGDLSHVFQEHDFDIAYTVRPHRVRINAGVMFVRSTHPTRRFFDKWNYHLEKLLGDDERPALHKRLRKHAGLDQAALAESLEAVDYPTKFLELPCTTYNSVDQTWHEFDETTKILHVKGPLRRFAVLDDVDPSKHPSFSKPMQVWRDHRDLALAGANQGALQ